MRPNCWHRDATAFAGRVPRKIESAIGIASGPLSRRIAIAPSPKAVEIAAMVSLICPDEFSVQARRRRRWCGDVHGLVLFAFMICAQANAVYPETKKVEVRESYHGVEVADPYRWLEDDNSS